MAKSIGFFFYLSKHNFIRRLKLKEKLDRLTICMFSTVIYGVTLRYVRYTPQSINTNKFHVSRTILFQFLHNHC